jgi:plasmid stabilization system protein ParE
MTPSFRVLYLGNSRADLASEYRYSQQQWGAKHARAYFASMREEIERLTEHPQAHGHIPGQSANWRRIVFPGHQVLYRINDETKTIEIFGILGRNRFGEIANVIQAQRRS